MDIKDKVKQAFNAFIENSPLEPVEVKMELNAPDGEYVNAEGGTIVVSDNSVSYVEPQEAEEEAPAEEEMKSEEATEMAAEATEEVSGTEVKLAEAIAEITNLKKQLEEMSVVEPISAAPQKPEKQKPIEINKNQPLAYQAFTHFLNQKINN